MKAINFSYNGLLASDFGLMICKFDNSEGFNTIEVGSELSLDIISLFNGNKYALVNTSYNEVNYTFQICKSYCNEKYITPLTINEQRKIVRWLNRNDGYFPLQIIQSGYENIIFEGTFNLSAIKFEGEVYGYELTFMMNRPFAIQTKTRFVLDFSDISKKYTIMDKSDNIGYIYPKIEIKCKSNGDLHLHNSIEDRTTYIKNCTQNEIITFDEYMNIDSSNDIHKLYNDFNFVFFRIANTFKYKKNDLTISLPCTIKLKYSPVVKMSF